MNINNHKLTGIQAGILAVFFLLVAVDIVIVVRKFIIADTNITLSVPAAGGTKRKQTSLRAVNGSARNGKRIEKGYAYYRFTGAQRKNARVFFETNGNEAVTIHIRRIDVPAAGAGEDPFMFGLLYARDFSGGMIRNKLSGRPLVHADLAQFSDCALSFSLPSSARTNRDEQPEGFFIYTATPVALLGSSIDPAVIGWKLTADGIFCGFCPDGGTLSADPFVDFSACRTVFPSAATETETLPSVSVTFKPTDSYGTADDQKYVLLSAGGEEIKIRRAAHADAALIPVCSLASPYAPAKITTGADMVSSLTMVQSNAALCVRNGRVLDPYKVDPGLIIAWPKSSWRVKEYELFMWDRFPGVLFFDTADYAVQNDFFRRLAYYAEKTGYRGTLVSDDILKDKHGYNAHDYSAETLAAFFTKAAKEKFQLNQKELLLREILTYNGVIVKRGADYKAGRGAVISISQDSALWLRQRLTAHEGWHGIFFTDEQFRSEVSRVYDSIDRDSRSFLLGYWRTQPDLNYDQNDSYLIHNEFMAYIMQQPVSDVASYFVHIANRPSVMNGEPVLAQKIKEVEGKTFEPSANQFNEYAFAHWGLACGRISLISR